MSKEVLNDLLEECVDAWARGWRRCTDASTRAPPPPPRLQSSRAEAEGCSDEAGMRRASVIAKRPRPLRDEDLWQISLPTSLLACALHHEVCELAGVEGLDQPGTQLLPQLRGRHAGREARRQARSAIGLAAGRRRQEVQQRCAQVAAAQSRCEPCVHVPPRGGASRIPAGVGVGL
uniref:Uncharacterized protein n=1 Tax=Alexandrium catenella TaxID=2925 RepID=A0A7S1S7I0_ALECA